MDTKKDGAGDFHPLVVNSFQDYPHRKTALISEVEILRLAARQVRILFSLSFIPRNLIHC